MMATTQPKLEELTAILKECETTPVKELLTRAETRIKLLREVSKMLDTKDTPKPRVKGQQTEAPSPVAGSVDRKAAS